MVSWWSGCSEVECLIPESDVIPLCTKELVSHSIMLLLLLVLIRVLYIKYPYKAPFFLSRQGVFLGCGWK
jgi:hypothetical protein